MSTLLSRFAENSFWMARYVERVENLARILDVNETFARDSQGASDWLPILRLNCDEEQFGERYRTTDAASVTRFYIIDSSNTNSVHCLIRAARENARSIRHLISLETWTQINVFYNWVASLSSRMLPVNELARICSRIKEGCQLHYGIVSGTLYRDQVWLFYRIGAFIELCDQITRLVDIKYHSLLPTAQDVGTPIDVAQWNALLRSASAYHGYRRVYPHEMTPKTVAGFILLDPNFPRSITSCMREIRSTLATLMSRDELRGVNFSMECIDELNALAGWSPHDVLAHGLHEYIDKVQLALLALGEQIDETFFLSRYSDS
jgi:uncharacterized alpha-E superfamily protein